MSSIQPINVLDKQEFAKMNKNEMTMNSYVSYLNNVNYDSFAPSFKGGRKEAAKTLTTAAKEEGKGFLADIGKNLKNKVMKTLAILMMAGGVATMTTSCDPIVDIDITINQDYDALYELLAAQNEAQNELLRQILLRLIANGETLEDINNNIINNGYKLDDLVAGNAELVAIMQRIEPKINHIDELSSAQVALLTNIFNVVMQIHSDSNTNYANLVAWLNQLLDKLDEMEDQEAEHHSAIIQAMVQMSEELQAKLYAILMKLNTMDQHMQQGYFALLAQLHTMQAEQQQQVLNILNKLDQIGVNLQTLLENFNNYSAQVQAGIMQILAKLDGMELQLQQLVASALNIIGNQETIINLMQQMQAEALAAYAEIIAHMGTIEQNQQYNAEWLARIFVQLQNNGIQLSEINQFLRTINFGPDVNLDVVIALLQQIIAQNEQHHNELLQNNTQNTQLIVNAINLIRAQLTAMQNDFNTNFSPAHFDYLERILNAIMGIDIETCNCDCELIIELLEQIASDIHDGINHEGYEEEDPYAELGLEP